MSQSHSRPLPYTRLRRAAVRCLSIGLLVASAPLAWSAPDAGSVLQQLEARPSGAAAAPRLQTPQGPTPPVVSADGPVVRVTGFRVEGAKLLSPQALQDALAGFAGRDLSLTQLQEAAWVLVQTYRSAGWLAHAYVPPQEVDQGLITLRVVEATLGQVLLEFPPGANLPRERIQAMADALLVPGQPINLGQVDRLPMLLDDVPGVRASVSFAQGQAIDSTDVLVYLGQEKAVDGTVVLDNFGAVSTGTARISVNLSLNNPGGWGDALQVQTVNTEGSRYGRLAYSGPVGVQGWRLGAHASDMRYALVGDFAALQASGSAQAWGADLSVPLVRQPAHNLSWRLSTDLKRFDNVALATGQSSEPSTSSSYRLDVLRSGLTGNWFDQSLTAAQNTASVQASWGQVDLANSPNAERDRSGARTDGGFRKINASYNREQSINGQTSWYLNAGAQWANRNLDSSEMLYLGGASGVRAYPSNEGGGAAGYTLTGGFRHRIDHALTLNSFADWGRIQVYQDNQTASGEELSSVNTQNLQGVGLSLSWRDTQGRELSATWSRRTENNPAARTPSGADGDGTLTLNRFWLSATLNF